MTIVNIQSNEQEKKEEATYKMGDMFLVANYYLCVLAQLEVSKFNLICIDNGNRYSDEPFSPRDCEHVTLNEIMSLVGEDGYDVVPVKSVSISYEL